MAEKLNYFDFAEDDYHSLMKAYNAGVVGNLICSNAQKVCERYLKHILDKYGQEEQSLIMRSHSLKTLKSELKKEVPDFTCDWNTIMNADGYYFTTTYPGDDAFFSDEDDTKACIAAITATRTAVLEFELMKEKEKLPSKSENDITENDAVNEALDEFDNDSPVLDKLLEVAEASKAESSEQNSMNNLKSTEER